MKDKSQGKLAPWTNNYEQAYSGKKGQIPNADFGAHGANVKESHHNTTGDKVFKTGRSGKFGKKY